MRVDVFILPPNEARYAQSALVMDCAPPRGTGQPTACAAAPRIIPNAALSGSSRLRKEWAARPAMRALVRSLRQRVISVFGGRNAVARKRASKNGWRVNTFNGR